VRLSENRFYSVVRGDELTTLQHAAYAPGSNHEAVLAQARARGIDGVVFGEVLDYQCDDELDDTDPETEDAVAGGPSVPESDVTGQRSQLQRSAEVAIAFKLVDARTGEVRAVRETRHQFSGASDLETTNLPSRGDVLDKLTDMCLEEFVELLAPHQIEKQMQLARAGWYGRDARLTREANRLAVQGDWDRARDLWQQAADRNPDCDSALFNLAIDATHRQQYAHAEELAMEAIRIRHTEQYADGLALIREYRSGFNSMQQQRDRRVLQAAATLR